MHRSFILSLLVSLFGLNLLVAQENNDELPPLPNPKEEDIICRCITTFTPKNKDRLFLKIDKEYYIVPLVGEDISPPLPIRGSRTLTFYRKALDKDKNEVYLPVLERPLKGISSQYLVILGRKGDKGYQATTHSLDSQQLKADHISIFNETASLMGVQVNKTTAVIKPREFYHYSFKGSDRQTYTSAKIIMRYKGENKIMASKRLRLVPGRRIIMVCFPSQKRVALGATPLRLVMYQDKPD